MKKILLRKKIKILEPRIFKSFENFWKVGYFNFKIESIGSSISNQKCWHSLILTYRKKQLSWGPRLKSQKKNGMRRSEIVSR